MCNISCKVKTVFLHVISVDLPVQVKHVQMLKPHVSEVDARMFMVEIYVGFPSHRGTPEFSKFL